jgi:molybdate/tungstate transport system substrate-binding protein
VTICLFSPIGVASASPTDSAKVDVLYAGSLVTVMQIALGPAFDGATGYTFNGFSGGSDALAADIKGRTQLADVFISASPAVNTRLEGSANGSWVRWYANFATSPLVLGYNPNSPFASQLKSKPWYGVVTEPGFLLGRTDPTTDPKGKLAEEVLNNAAVTDRTEALAQLAQPTQGVYPEETLVGRLQSGQLDAGFFYAAEAAAANIPTVPLGSIRMHAQYTITILNRSPHLRAAEAFVTFLESRQGRRILEHDGLSVLAHPTVVGASRVPATLRSVLVNP